MSDLHRLSGPDALAAVREEPRPAWLDAVIDEDAAEVAYDASVYSKWDEGEWHEYGQNDRDEWGVLIWELGTYESDTNVQNCAAVDWTWESCPTKHIARALATARNRGEPDPWCPAD